MNNPPVRLAKKEEPVMLSNVLERIKQWAMRHMNILLPIALVIAMGLFVAFCFAICGTSATESGTLYNQFNQTI